MSSNNNKLIEFAENFSFDHSGALRTSGRHVLGSYKKIDFDNPYLFNSVGTGTDSFSNNYNTMSVAAGEYVARQSKKFHPYYTSNPQRIDMTCINLAGQAGIIKRFGYYCSSTIAPYDSEFDGFFIQITDSEQALYIYNAGNLVEKILFQQFENYNYIEGKDLNAFNIWSFDFLWLGGSGIRIFIKTVNGDFIKLHEYNHAGIKYNTIFKSPQLPVRYEIRSTTGSGSFIDVCSTVISEGGEQRTTGFPIVAPIKSRNVVMVSQNNSYGLIYTRKKTGFRNSFVSLSETGAYSETTGDTEFYAVLNPTINGNSLNWTSIVNSPLEFALGDGVTNIITDGYILNFANIWQRDNISKDQSEDFSFLSEDIQGNRDIIALASRTDSNNTRMRGHLKFLGF
jgi:hypothetical protein